MDARNTVEGTSNVFLDYGINPDADVVFLSTNQAGAPGELNSAILEALGWTPAFMPSAVDLSAGYAILEGNGKLLCFIVTVGQDDTAKLLPANLMAALGDERLLRARSFWMPLIGTGAGHLPLNISFNMILAALRETGWLERTQVRIVLAGPEGWTPQARLDFPRNAAVTAALEFAAHLRVGRKGPGGPISTTLLFFALAESQIPSAPQALSTDTAASLFTGAVHAKAQMRFNIAWENYFSRGYVPSPFKSEPLPQFTSNVRQILTQALIAAQSRGQAEIEVEDLIISLLNFPQGSHVKALQTMGVEMPALLEAFRDAKIGQIGTTLLNDVASATDRLGYASYAKAITEFLVDPATDAPLSVSIQAPWGAGKSSLMRQIREQLDPEDEREKNKPKLGVKLKQLLLKDALKFLNRDLDEKPPEQSDPKKRWTIWFNAWKYDSSEQVWAGLVDSIVAQIGNRLPSDERELFLLRLQLARIDDGVIRRKIYDRILTTWWNKVRTWAGAAILAIVGLFGAPPAVKSLWDNPAVLKALAQAPWGATALLALYLVLSYLKSSQKTEKEPASFSLAEYLKVPDYDLSLGTIHHIHADLLRVLAVTPRKPDAGKQSKAGADKELKPDTSKRYPLVIFIDDLDRCSPSKVAAVVEGVSMFLASEDYQCIFIIGIDPQMIAAALEDAHCKVSAQLPRYERTVPLGWRFMDKFIQLPFTIPPSRKTALQPYVDWLSTSGNAKATPTDSGKAGDQGAPRPWRLVQVLLTFQAALKARIPWLGNPDHGKMATGPDSGKTDEPVAPALKPSRVVRTMRTFKAAWKTRTPWLGNSDTEKMATDQGSGQADEPVEPAPKPSPTVQAIREFEESKDVGSIIRDTANSGFANPREIKRLANLARLYLGLRNARRTRDSIWRAPSTGQYCRWIILTVKWPDMMRWLQWGADEATWPAKELIYSLEARRLRKLETLAKQFSTAEEWKKELGKDLFVPIKKESDWAADPKLFEFFQAEMKLPVKERLSTAVEMEFW